MNDGNFNICKAADLSVRELIDLCALLTPDAVYLIDPVTGEEISYSELRSHAFRIASVISSCGVPEGSCVAYAFGNSVSSGLIILGILYGGYVATAINLVAGHDRILYMLEHSGARLVIFDTAGKDLVCTAVHSSSCNPLLFDMDYFFSSVEEESSLLSDVFYDSDGLLMYTSGTTGLPKGVILTHGNLISGGYNTALAHELTPYDRGMCILPFYHINGFCVTLMGSLVAGASLVVPNNFSVQKFWSDILRYKCSWFSVVPTQISYLLQQELDSIEHISTVRFGRSASSPLSPELHSEFESRFGIPIIETMGLTETAAQILSNPLPPHTRKVGSVGIAYGNEVRISDSDGQEVVSGIEGEIWVRGSNVMRCYFKDEVATNKILSFDGWFRTGDLGWMDEEGYVYVTGRLKELIIKGGENIAPREIDDVLYGHPDVLEAASFGRPCSNYGETVEAAVTIRSNASVQEHDLIGLCRSRLGLFKSPERIYFLSSLPKGSSGKIQRGKLLDLIK